MPDRAGDDSPTGSDTLILFGRITGAHGIRGEVRINSFAAVPEDIAAYGPLSDGKSSTFVIEKLRVLRGMAVAAKLAGISDRNDAEALKGTELFVARSKLPETEEDEWYYDDLIGLAVVAPDDTPIGIVHAVQNFGAGDLLEIRIEGERKTLLVPFTKAFVPVVDIAGRRVVVDQAEEIDDESRD